MKVIRYTNIKPGDVISVLAPVAILTDITNDRKKRPVHRMKRNSDGLADVRTGVQYTTLDHVLVLNSSMGKAWAYYAKGRKNIVDSRQKLFHILTADGPTYIEIWEDEVEILLHTV